MELPKDIADRITWQKGALEQDSFRVKKIKHEPKPCEDCGKLVEDRRIRISVSKESHVRQGHCKHHCQSCKLYKNPITGEFDMTFHQIHTHFYKSQSKKKDK
jgi:hypothetical protein